ncbi:sulfotransferase-like domain-containing protein [Asanoa iriomotensis]|uniref:Branched chain amino acid aminotransferase n=1 Tax=Asanoa iriomotensis TaxID=234613 RepID=A0ABQ4CFV0_9ACTN|nr:HAD family hydrolase [Asanoa iriomotensis]GIF61658.1 branched chain amino acid aminotransferase [Asanoa iriomotensis]
MIRIAMWSGPRNVSTALMRSFGARPDCAVVDEPLYAAYLAATGLDHPGRAEVLASQPTHWAEAVSALRRPSSDSPVQYEKHMAHHLLPQVGRLWLGEVTNAYLIRDPAHVVASYAKVRGEPTLEDLGYPQQVEIFRAHGGPVLDSAALLRDPAGQLRKLCAALGIAFDEAMLSWPAGRRDTDGVWAPHWYGAVERSTGFAPYRAEPVSVPPDLAHLVVAAKPFYDELAAHAL